MTTMLQTSNIIWKNVSLTDEIKINLEYDIHRGLLNIFVKNIGGDDNNNNKLPSHINVISNESSFEQISNDEPQICYEISTTYVYDIIDTNENIEEIDFSQTRFTLLSSSSSYTTDNDDGYSTHSFDDIEHQHQQLSLVIPPSKLTSSSYYYSEQYVSPIRRIIEQMTWLNPFKRTVQEMMMMNHMFM